MLGGRRAKTSGWIRNQRAVTKRPDALHPFHFQVGVHLDASMLFWQIKLVQQRVGRRASGPNQCKTCNRCTVAQCYLSWGDRGYFGVGAQLDATFRQLGGGIASEIFAKLR